MSDGSSLLDSMLAEQRMRWRSGTGELVEARLAQHPALAADSNAVLDLLYNEVLLRRERGEAPTADEYLQRFPDLADSLKLLFEVDHGLEDDGNYLSIDAKSPETPVEAIDPKRTPADLAATPAGMSGRTKPGSNVEAKLAPRLVATDSFRGSVELNALLQRRLRFVSILVTLMYVQSGWQLRTIWHIDQWPHYQFQMAVVWAVLAIAGSSAALFLLVRRQLPVVWLRVIEIVLFAAPVVQLTCVLADLTWLQGDLLRFLRAQGHDSGYLFNSMALFYFPSITCYGILIPNTIHRCLAIELTMGLTPLVLLLAGLPFVPEIWADHRVAFLEGFFWVAMWMGVGVACAVYGCHRINTLQQEALVARRLGQYRLRQRLGSGGMGEVYLAEHVLLKQPCAVKIIRPERAGDPSALRRFEREVQATARLKHWNTVTIFDYGIAADGTFYYAMEYLPGLNLEDMVRLHGPLPPARVCYFLRQACAALREAHAIGLIHRDIKPANLIVCERGGAHDVLKVLDFGLVRDCSAAQTGGTLTAEGVVAGTPAYMSPEQAAGADQLDARSDVYSLGAVAYFLLTGQPPFGNRTQVQVLAAHLYEAPRPPAEVRSQVPQTLSAVVLKCLAKKPADRFSDMPTLDAAVAELSDAGSWSEADAAAWWHEHAASASTAEVGLS